MCEPRWLYIVSIVSIDIYRISLIEGGVYKHDGIDDTYTQIRTVRVDRC
jgi:hypothetical protein